MTIDNDPSQQGRVDFGPGQRVTIEGNVIGNAPGLPEQESRVLKANTIYIGERAIDMNTVTITQIVELVMEGAHKNKRIDISLTPQILSWLKDEINDLVQKINDLETHTFETTQIKNLNTVTHIITFAPKKADMSTSKTHLEKERAYGENPPIVAAAENNPDLAKQQESRALMSNLFNKYRQFFIDVQNKRSMGLSRKECSDLADFIYDFRLKFIDVITDQTVMQAFPEVLSAEERLFITNKLLEISGAFTLSVSGGGMNPEKLSAFVDGDLLTIQSKLQALLGKFSF